MLVFNILVANTSSLLFPILSSIALYNSGLIQISTFSFFMSKLMTSGKQVIQEVGLTISQIYGLQHFYGI